MQLYYQCSWIRSFGKTLNVESIWTLELKGREYLVYHCFLWFHTFLTKFREFWSEWCFQLFLHLVFHWKHQTWKKNFFLLHVLEGDIGPKKKANSNVLGILIPQFQPRWSPAPSCSQILRPPANVQEMYNDGMRDEYPPWWSECG